MINTIVWPYVTYVTEPVMFVVGQPLCLEVINVYWERPHTACLQQAKSYCTHTSARIQPIRNSPGGNYGFCTAELQSLLGDAVQC